MTSQRKRKKQASSRGMSVTELQLLEMIEEMLDAMRWMQILGYTNQFLVNQKLAVDEEERDRVLQAATRAVEKDGRLRQWQGRLARIKEEALRVQQQLEGELPEPGQEAAPDGPQGAEEDGASGGE